MIEDCCMKATSQAMAQEQDASEKVLVKNASAFLKQRLQRLAPDAVLTHAWDSFYRTYTGILRRMAGEFHLDAGESEDLVQEVWAQVIVHLPEFDWRGHGSGLRGWLYTLVRNKALNYIRRKVRDPVRLGGSMPVHEVADRTPGPAEQWEARWDRELMQLLLADLKKKISPLNHRLLILRWIEGRPLADVAQLLKLSERQVTYRQQRLFRKLRAARALYRGEPFGANPDGPRRAGKPNFSDFRAMGNGERCC
jgi:RNA polymerase sigma factor (sigma-70 family)